MGGIHGRGMVTAPAGWKKGRAKKAAHGKFNEVQTDILASQPPI